MILAYDIGTTFLKGAVVTETGRVVARRAGAHPMAEGAEGEPVRVRRGRVAVGGGAGHCAARDCGKKEGLRGVVVSANGPTLVPVDAELRAARPAMSWMDQAGDVKRRS